MARSTIRHLSRTRHAHDSATLYAAIRAGEVPVDLAAAVSGRFQPFSDPDAAPAAEPGRVPAADRVAA